MWRRMEAGLLCAVLGCAGLAVAQNPDKTTPMSSMQMGSTPMGSMSMSHGKMAEHMMWSKPRTVQPGDDAKAATVAATAKVAIEPYKDYKKALSDGYQIFLPELPQKVYHFTNYLTAMGAARRFDATRPTSLLYEKTKDGGYKLVGAMYTARQNAPEATLNERIPLSIARWHQHTNFCQAPLGHEHEYFGKDAKYGLLGSITTREQCDAAGGEFRPTLFGWMVHVYPFEADTKEIWSVERDDDDNMQEMKM